MSSRVGRMTRPTAAGMLGRGMTRDRTKRRATASAALLGVAAGIGVFGGTAGGQVVLDGTLGPAGARQGPNYIIPQSVGQLRGTNLFHSFSRFDLAAGESATFTASADTPIANVVARVTGPDPSNINGLLRSAVPGANLVFVNPRGVVFGPGAQLDVQGSFVATTAAYVRLSDGAVFSAVAPADAALTTAPPAAFGFLPAAGFRSLTLTGTAAGGQTSTLSVPAGRSLSLIGGGVRITTTQVKSPGGQINVVAAGGGEVRLDTADAAATPDVSAASLPGPVELRGGAALASPSGGGVAVRAGRMLLDRSVLSTETDLVTGRDIDLAVAGDLDVVRGRISSNTTGPAAGGNIWIAAGTLAVAGLAAIDASGPITSSATSTGRGGDVVVKAGSVSIADEGSIQSIAFSAGRGGDIRVTADRDVRITGRGVSFLTGLAAETNQGVSAAGGDIAVTARRVEITNAGEISASTKGTGPAGGITIEAQSLVMDGQDAAKPTLIQARVGNGVDGTGASGAGGKIVVRADDVDLRRGGVITATTFGSGKGGDIDLTAGRTRLVGSDRSLFTGVFATSSPAANVRDPGPAGTVTVAAGRLTVAGPAQVSATSQSNQAAGVVRVTTGSDLVVRAGGQLVASAPNADGGNLVVAAGRSAFVTGGVLTAEAGGAGGNITLRAGEAISIDRSLLTALAGKDGGRVVIAPPVFALRGSTFDARAGIDDGGVVTASGGGSTFDPQAGGIPVKVQVDSANFLSSSSHIRTDRAIDLPGSDIAGTLLPLRVDFTAAGPQLVPACGLLFGTNVSSFVVTGRGGRPAEPGGWEAEWGDYFP